jgi:hypothetical protein
VPVGALQTEGTEGTASLKGLAPGSYTVAAGGLGFGSVIAEVQVRAGATETQIALPRLGVGTTSVAVRGADGTALSEQDLARCRIAIERAPFGDTMELALAGPTGMRLLALAPGDYTLRLLEPRPGGAPIPLHVDDGDAREVTLLTGGGPGLAGRVLSGDGNPVGEPVRIGLVRLEPGDDPREVGMRAELLGPDAAATDADGRFQLGPLGPGRYLVLARRSGKDRGVSPVMRIPPPSDARPLELRLDTRDYGEARLELELVPDGGDGMAGHLPAELIVSIRGFDPPTRLLRETDKKGRIVLSGLPQERSVWVEVRATDGSGGRVAGVGALRFVAEEGTPVVRRRLTLRPPITLSGSTAGFAGRAVGPGTIDWGVVQLNGAPPERLETIRISDDGSFEIPDLDPNREIQLTVRVDRHLERILTTKPEQEFEVHVTPKP